MAATFKALAHGASRAAIAQAQGQSARAGFWSGFAASGFSIGTKGYGGFVGRTVLMATVSGTVSEATGGKFANGAMTGAFVHMFNGEWSAYRDPNKVAFGDREPKTAVGRILNKATERGIQGAVTGAIRTRTPAGALAYGTLGTASGLVEGMAIESGLNINSVSKIEVAKVIINETR